MYTLNCRELAHNHKESSSLLWRDKLLTFFLKVSYLFVASWFIFSVIIFILLNKNYAFIFLFLFLLMVGICLKKKNFFAN